MRWSASTCLSLAVRLSVAAWLGACAPDPCVEGAPCVAPGEGNACREGIWRCTLTTRAGEEHLAHCEPTGPRAAGAPCGEGGVCDGEGQCLSCVEDSACDTGNPCSRGAWRCGGAPTCAAVELLEAGSPCGVSGACTADGFCAECVDPPHSCDVEASCSRGLVLCEDGPARCVAVPRAAGEPCAGEDRGTCDGEGACLECGGATTEAACSDGEDDDCDGLVDCADPDCDAQTCDDGVFCNGADSCDAGSCAAHAGDPCGGAGVCDEAGQTCTCATDADCPDELRGPLGACTDATDACVQEATRAQDVTSYACVAGTCEATTVTEAMPCTRSTSGDSCGDVSFGAWGACAYPSTCAQTETQSRQVITPRCRFGDCRNYASSESRSCATTRTTDGTTCGVTAWAAATSCAGFADACDESGTETWERTVGACAAGACSTSTESEVRSCARASTDGASCTSCGGGSCACVAEVCQPTRTVRANPPSGAPPHPGPGLTVTCDATGASCTRATEPSCTIQCPQGSSVSIVCDRGPPCDIFELSMSGAASTTCPRSAFFPEVCDVSCSAVVGSSTLNVYCDTM